MEICPDKDGILLGTLFQKIVTDWKSSSPAWDDFVNKGCKLHNSLKSTTLAMSAFVDSIQKIADAATNTKGSTKDVGSALTRVCVRQKLVENKLRHFTNSFMDKFIAPIQDKLEELKKTANQLEKDHAKDFKRATTEIKKRKDDYVRLQKKIRKGSKPDVHYQLNLTVQDVSDRCSAHEETEKSALRNLLVEERTRICFFASSFSPLLDLQVSMMNEVNHLQDLNANMMSLCRNPKQLPNSTDQLVNDFLSNPTDQASTFQQQDEQAIADLQNNKQSTPSPARHDNQLSSFNTSNDIDLRSLNTLHRSSTVRLRHNPKPNQIQRNRRRSSSGSNTFSSETSQSFDVERMSSVSSRDSGFVSGGSADLSSASVTLHSTFKEPFSASSDKNFLANAASSSNPAPLTTDQPPAPGQLPKFSWKHWKIPGPYELVQNGTMLESTKQVAQPISPEEACLSQYSSFDDAVSQHETLPPQFAYSLPHSATNLPPPHQSNVEDTCDIPLPPPPASILSNNFDQYHQENASRSFSSASTRPQVVPGYNQGNVDYHSLSLGRKNNNNSLQYSASSGYSSQYTTPACSEDTIASQDIESSSQESDESFNSRIRQEKYFTLPRNYHHGRESAFKSFQCPTVSTEVVSSTFSASNGDVSRTATIRRKPSSKFNSVRLPSATPKPIRTPTVPSGCAVTNLLSTFVPPSINNTNTNNDGTLF